MSTSAAAPRLALGIVTPCPRRSCAGNRITALRWAALLRGLGHRTFVEEEWSGRPCDALIALHAGKSARSVERFKERHAGRPAVVLLTGTDVYGGLAADEAALAALARADRVAVLQPHALRELPAALRAKACVVRQSAAAPRRRDPPAEDAFEVSVVGHLRDVKDPLRAALAARLLPASSRLRVLHAGEAMSDAMRAAAEREARENPRYRWLGRLPHARTVELIARTRLHVLTSRSEGGANVVSEALAAGVPVVSSRIDGSLGILGDAYPGYFEAGDERALSRLLLRCEGDVAFLAALARWCRRLGPLVAPEREQQALAQLLAELLPRSAVAPVANGAAPGAAPRLRELGGEIDLPFTRIAASVKEGLARRPRRLDCRWFYDEAGSRLFEEICATPEYYVTRAEDEILRDRAGEIAALVPGDAAVVELGGGSATKTRRLLDALLGRQPRLRCVMIDISESALAASARALLAAYPRIELVSICAEYEDGLARLDEVAPAPRLLLWLGSNVGNFHRDEAAAFLGRVRAALAPEDRLLIGIDLRKERAALERAYDDAAGVTARFNRNLLARVNRELGGSFDLAAFRHEARWDEGAGRVEMWLVSERPQRVRIELLDLDVDLAAGEAIHTENSYKYSPAEIEALASAAGFEIAGQWFDRARRFSDSLLAPVAGRR